jgi:hypothetical protein
MQRRNAMRAMLGAALSALPIAALKNHPVAYATGLSGVEPMPLLSPTGRYFGMSSLPVTDLGPLRPTSIRPPGQPRGDADVPLPTRTLTEYLLDGKVGPHRVSPFPSQLRASRDLPPVRLPLKARLGQALRRFISRRLG